MSIKAPVTVTCCIQLSVSRPYSERYKLLVYSTDSITLNHPLGYPSNGEGLGPLLSTGHGS